jgi:hypothetical protein
MLNGSPILTPPRIRAECIVDLLSRAVRPWLFKVTVWAVDGPGRRIYEIPALSDDDAARNGLQRFEREMMLKAAH